MTAYKTLEAHYARLAKVQGATGMLHWDMAAMMPKGGASTRAEQLATLSVIAHEMACDPKLGDLFAAADALTLSDWQQANLREMKRGWRHASAVPSDLVEAISKAGSDCEFTWRTARKANDWATMRPKLEAVFALTRQKAQAKGEAMGLSPYEAMLDLYEPGGSTERIDAIFDELATFLPGFTQEVIEKQAAGPKVHTPQGPFSVEAQRALGLKLMGVIGFDFDHGRLDVSHHPFCGGVPDDVRITTRYATDDFTQSLMGVIHETGHAMYERGLPAEWRYQPVGEARGMSMHESQSLLMEMQACRSPEFLAYASPLIRDAFGGEGPAWTEDNLQHLYTRVERGLIRVDADEVTYPAHVILRYRLERLLLAGDLKIADLPDAWNAGMAELVGIVPPDYADGCLQDIHWMDGTVGYFPTYTLGAMTAAQLFGAACKADPDIKPGLRRGDFTPLLGWLRTHVHGKGSLLSTDDLLREATGTPLDGQIFQAHLRQRFLGE